MVKIIWTQRSLDDLEDIGDYISQDSFYYAKRTLEKIIESALLIEINPLMGRMVPEINDKSIRELINGNYHIIFQIREQAIYILTIFHCARFLSGKELE
jgi:toxin ParE1/3/4